eukprot:1139278-Ditylum_brightwellii.AAC.1
MTRKLATSNQTVGGLSSFSKNAAMKKKASGETTTANSSIFSKPLGMGQSLTGLELGNGSEIEGCNTKISFSMSSQHIND